ncbi:DUF262 domain-containing protein [Clostridium botulinum]|uniref:DUF262 domain-containing protein n=1 Tax=Clostridium botulinum TaxID=1491 RepID=UPI00035BA85F|nr:DUF262 domain-containing protein [Clostridium botulinum]AJD28704.1 hypothetical protein T257_1014 [Clostridium botulinum CDC_297]EPS48962.1 hypothetical protein CFSAN002368_18716 [Clostridium botulinum A1 str. CFSAN002368]KIN80414.1 hypothetical protein SD74_15820 [Clostridium botulinum]MBY6875818.1 DUF262 domain-containing protein [Clostridium botulinum]MBY6890526.1 DUF262 domain-containing protein [Clostridium botulinum]
MDNIEIINSVDEKIEKVRTRSLDLSFNELMDMYESEELIIDPEYQRMFRWNEVKQSQFIESLILELPVPPIFVIETKDNEYELIDGLQRISSYLHFRGKLPLDENNKTKYLTLQDCDILEELEGKTYDDLPKAIQIRLKRNFIRVEVLRKENNNKLRYYMFKRLNSGGEKLSDQEIRNCTIRIMDNTFNDCIIKCSLNLNFKNTISKLDDEKIRTKADQELVLRFFTLKNDMRRYKHPFAEYLTKYMEEVAEGKLSFDCIYEEELFDRTFYILNNLLGKDSFSSILSSGNFKEDLVLYHFDALVLGIQKHLDILERIIRENDIQKMQQINDLLKSIKASSELIKYRTGTKGNIENRMNLISSKIEDLVCSWKK